MTPPELVVVGAASRDAAADDARGWRLGGGVAYGALAAARLGVRTAALIGVDDAAATATELDLLRAASVDVVLVRLGRGPVFTNDETAGGRIQHSDGPADAVAADALPAAWRDSQGWMFAPVADELPAAWAAVPGSAALVALGWQGLLRTLPPNATVERREPAASPLLDRADIVGVSRDDVGPGATMEGLLALLRPGATLVLTGGVAGGIVAVATPGGVPQLSAYPAIPAPGTVDPTGAGDVFLSALLCARVQPRLVAGRIGQRFDLLLAAAVASLVTEGHGLLGVPDRSAIRRRMAEGLARRSAPPA